MARGKIIVIEGCEGCGKSTVIDRLKLHFAGNSKFLFTREPGGTPIGTEIRKVILNPAHTAMTPLSELMLFYADRTQHIEEMIEPALARGVNVLMDRGDPSTIAYQIYGGERSHLLKEALRLAGVVWGRNLIGEDTKVYDGIVYLDILPETGLKRKIVQNIRDESRIDQKKLDFHNRVHSAYLNMARLSLFGPWHSIDASQSKEKVFEKSLEAINSIITN